MFQSDITKTSCPPYSGDMLLSLMSLSQALDEFISSGCVYKGWSSVSVTDFSLRSRDVITCFVVFCFF